MDREVDRVGGERWVEVDGGGTRDAERGRVRYGRLRGGTAAGYGERNLLPFAFRHRHEIIVTLCGLFTSPPRKNRKKIFHHYCHRYPTAVLRDCLLFTALTIIIRQSVLLTTTAPPESWCRSSRQSATDRVLRCCTIIMIVYSISSVFSSGIPLLGYQ